MSEENANSEVERAESELDPAVESKPVAENIKSPSIWLRGFIMLVIAFIWGISRFVTVAVVIIQFFCALLTGEPNNNLKKFGAQLATYSAQIINYLTFNTEERPFPFDTDWPSE